MSEIPPPPIPELPPTVRPGKGTAPTDADNASREAFGRNNIIDETNAHFQRQRAADIAAMSQAIRNDSEAARAVEMDDEELRALKFQPPNSLRDTLSFNESSTPKMGVTSDEYRKWLDGLGKEGATQPPPTNAEGGHDNN